MRRVLRKQQRLTAGLAMSVVICVLAVFGFPVHAQAAAEAQRDIFAMDTYMSIRTFGENAEEAADAGTAEIRRLDELWSVGMDASEVSKLNREKEAEVSPETLELVERALEIGRITEGAFDITVYPLMEAWGFTTGEYRVPDAAEIAELLTKVDLSAVQTDTASAGISFSARETAVDLGGIAKGYTSARLMEIFREHGVEHAIVSLGGNVQTLGAKKDGSLWKIGIQDPTGKGDYLGVVEVSDCAVITSGGYERYFEQDGQIYHHILDPSTGYPAESGLVSVSIISPDGTLADALSTALFVMGEKKASSFWKEHAEEFDMILLTDDGRLLVSEGIREKFTAAEGWPVEAVLPPQDGRA